MPSSLHALFSNPHGKPKKNTTLMNFLQPLPTISLHPQILENTKGIIRGRNNREFGVISCNLTQHLVLNFPFQQVAAMLNIVRVTTAHSNLLGDLAHPRN